MGMLSKIGWFVLGIGSLLLAGVFAFFGGAVQPEPAIMEMASHLFWGGIIWFGILLMIMASLFLS
jgi:hypothetical protein